MSKEYLELSKDYAWTTSKSGKSIILKKHGSKVVLPLRDIYRLEYDLWSWLDSRGLGHIKARYCDGLVVYQIVGKHRKYKFPRILNKTISLMDKVHRAFCTYIACMTDRVLDFFLGIFDILACGIDTICKNKPLNKHKD